MAKQVRYAAWSRTGRVRSKNQDNLYCAGVLCLAEENDGMEEPRCAVSDIGTGQLFAVFDGMGGERAGETAAYLAADCMRQADSRYPGWKKAIAPRKFFLSYCREANRKIDDLRRVRRFQAMGTTAAAALILRRRVVVCNIGDSRIYRVSGQAFTQISTDHAEQRFVGSPALTQYLGVPAEEMQIEPAVSIFPYRAGDQYLLCSDGVWNSAGEDELRGRFLSGNGIEERVRNLFGMVSESGERDNATAVLLELT